MGPRFCNNCGAEIPEGQPGNCPKCGAGHAISGAKKPVLAAVLSLFIPGLGQSYNGNALKGIGIFLGVAILWVISLFVYSDALFIVILIWILGVYDAYRDAGRMNRAEIPEKKHQMLLFGLIAVVAVVILAAIMFLYSLSLFMGVYGVPQGPNDKTAEMRVQYNGSVFANYGTGDCFFRKDIPGQKVIRFDTFGCHMSYASFTKNDTQPGELRVDLVRDGRVVKSYSTAMGNSTAMGSVYFRNVDEFLQQVSKDPGLVRETPVTVRVLTDGEWSGSIDDKYGTQSAHGSGPATLTLTQPVLPVEACVRNPKNSLPDPITVEIYAGDVLLKRSDTKNTNGENCVKILQFTS
jgi:TM2 domain-containing membrane protein YozV